jgi:putative modified peptide
MHFEVNMTPQQGKDFATKLATDDAFRAKLEEDPEATLAQYNIHVAPGQIKRPVQLPSKEQFHPVMQHAGSGVAAPEISSEWVWVVWAAFLAFL